MKYLIANSVGDKQNTMTAICMENWSSWKMMDDHVPCNAYDEEDWDCVCRLGYNNNNEDCVSKIHQLPMGIYGREDPKKMAHVREFLTKLTFQPQSRLEDSITRAREKIPPRYPQGVHINDTEKVGLLRDNSLPCAPVFGLQISDNELVDGEPVSESIISLTNCIPSNQEDEPVINEPVITPLSGADRHTEAQERVGQEQLLKASMAHEFANPDQSRQLQLSSLIITLPPWAKCYKPIAEWLELFQSGHCCSDNEDRGKIVNIFEFFRSFYNRQHVDKRNNNLADSSSLVSQVSQESSVDVNTHEKARHPSQDQQLSTKRSTEHEHSPSASDTTADENAQNSESEPIETELEKTGEIGQQENVETVSKNDLVYNTQETNYREFNIDCGQEISTESNVSIVDSQDPQTLSGDYRLSSSDAERSDYEDKTLYEEITWSQQPELIEENLKDTFFGSEEIAKQSDSTLAKSILNLPDSSTQEELGYPVTLSDHKSEQENLSNAEETNVFPVVEEDKGEDSSVNKERLSDSEVSIKRTEDAKKLFQDINETFQEQLNSKLLENIEENISIESVSQSMLAAAQILSRRYHPSFGSSVQQLQNQLVDIYPCSDMSSSCSDVQSNRSSTSSLDGDTLLELVEDSDDNLKLDETNTTLNEQLEGTKAAVESESESLTENLTISADTASANFFPISAANGQQPKVNLKSQHFSRNLDECVDSSLAQIETKVLQNRNLIKSDNLTLDECRHLQRAVFEISRRNLCRIFQLSFSGRTLYIQYLNLSAQELNQNIERFKLEILSCPALQEENIHVIFKGIASPKPVLRTGPGLILIGIGNKTKISASRGTKLTALIEAKFLESGHVQRFALSCGHDKMKGDEGYVDANVYTPVAQDNGNSYNRRPEPEKRCVRVKHLLVSDWYDDVYDSGDSVDASLMIQNECCATEELCKGYIIRKVFVNHLRKHCFIRIYVDGFVPLNTGNFKVQIHDETGRTGEVVEFIPYISGTAKSRPIYNVYKIVGEDNRAIHAEGDSGLLVTTVLDETKLVRHHKKNFYIGRVQAVGMLVACVKVSEDSGYSLAIPISNTLKYLEKFIFKEEAALKISGGKVTIELHPAFLVKFFRDNHDLQRRTTSRVALDLLPN